MKKPVLICVAIILCTIAYAQDPGTYMYERIYLTPKPDKIKMLNQNLAAHNKKYHGEGEHAAFVQSVITGRRSGDYVWIMGPTTFSALDNRPAEGGHDDDWSDNVMPYVEELAQSEYWVRDDEHFYTPQDYTGDKIRVRFHRIKGGKNDDFRNLMAKIAKVYRDKKYNRSFAVYWNTFPTARGRNVATVSGFINWAYYDQNNNFVADFESVHGKDSWQPWIDTLWEVIEWTDNEVLQTVPELSGT